MFKIFSVLLFAALPWTAQGVTLDFTFTLGPSGEYFEVTSEEIKTCDSFDEDESACTLARVIDEKELPFVFDFGGATFSISKKGLVTLEASYGDSDGSVAASLQLPLDEKGNFISLPGPLHFNTSGGDHASGMWSFSGSASIWIE